MGILFSTREILDVDFAIHRLLLWCVGILFSTREILDVDFAIHRLPLWCAGILFSTRKVGWIITLLHLLSHSHTLTFSYSHILILSYSHSLILSFSSASLDSYSEAILWLIIWSAWCWVAKYKSGRIIAYPPRHCFGLFALLAVVAQKVAVDPNFIGVAHLLALDIRELHAQLLGLA